MVIDDFGEGIPVAWAVSNKEDQKSIITLFLEAVNAMILHVDLVYSCPMMLHNIGMRGSLCLGRIQPRSFSAIGTLTEPGEML